MTKGHFQNQVHTWFAQCFTVSEKQSLSQGRGRIHSGIAHKNKEGCIAEQIHNPIWPEAQRDHFSSDRRVKTDI